MRREVTVQSQALPVANLLAFALGAVAVGAVAIGRSPSAAWLSIELRSSGRESANWKSMN
jgi:hypothetical protein